VVPVQGNRGATVLGRLS